ncbi:murein hydrolase activator EnvC family protein [Peptoanaerobacter stomatis]
MNKKIIITLFFIFTIFSLAVYADKTQELNNINHQIDDIRVQIGDKREKLSALNEEILKIDAQITVLESKIQNLEKQINDVQSKINVNIEKIAQKEKEIKSLTTALENRIRVMSKINNLDYIQIIFSSKNLGDALSNYTIIKKIIQQDKDNLKKLETAKLELNNINKELTNMKLSLTNLQNSYNKENGQLKLAKANQESNMAKLQSDITSLAQIAQLKMQEAQQITQELKQLTASSQNSYKGTYSGGKFAFPVSGGVLTSYFGYRNHPILNRKILHTGIDIGGSMGTPIISAENGRVIYAGPKSTYGNTVMIDHGSGVVTLYAHCSSIDVFVCQNVSKGQVIAKVGTSGRSTGPHLHFEVRINGEFTDPLPYVR